MINICINIDIVIIINIKVKNYSINKSDLDTYRNVGKLLFDVGNQYGESIIKEYSLKLTEELGSGFSQRNLRNMRQFYKVSQNWQTVSAKLSWSHYCELLVIKYCSDDRIIAREYELV